ncbi:hypothetical protein GC102_09395 [Paenibacillus sp. LMG 31460]|uniref:Heparinase II/III-like protein n=1 Tax=Paenibacillus germinis TaxID=2654979 RepID=A0ABX1Z0P7_9BACL|nr:heparinase II/III family protein [Paenibacillus germinis]NOU85989.1 hypothetical protein [Paenibacillus germinis]
MARPVGRYTMILSLGVSLAVTSLPIADADFNLRAEASSADSAVLKTASNVIGKWSSADVKHPIPFTVKENGNEVAAITKMFASFQKPNEDDAKIMQGIAPIMAMTEEDLIEAARKNAETRTRIDIHPEYETMVSRMAQMYGKTGDEQYARRAILVMQQFAQGYGAVPKSVNIQFHSYKDIIPIQCVYAYDLIYNSEQWKTLSSEVGGDIRSSIEDWFREAAMDMYNLGNEAYLSNIVPYGLRNVLGTAVILNDPDMIRLFIPWFEKLLSGTYFHADGIWHEGTISYHNQVVGNIVAALDLLKLTYSDPKGYVDKKLGLKLDHTDLSPMWSLLEKAKQIPTILQFPDGRPIALNDADANTNNKSAADPIKNLNNIELWHFGHIALTAGDRDDATQVNLSFNPLAEGTPYSGGHYHANNLGLILWGAGMEMLPDSGYMRSGPTRFFHMDAVDHNVGWVWSKDASNYKSRASQPTRASMLAYDPGTLSGKRVQLIEASSPGPEGDLAEVKRRHLMLVQIDGNRSYVVDLQRLKGGQAHELYLRSEEDEASQVSTPMELVQHPGETTEGYLKSIGKEEGLPDYRNLMSNPQVGNGSADFQFTSIGSTSGSSIRAYMNGIPDSEVIFSEVPTMRRTGGDAKKAFDFPGWHLYRRHIVNPETVTRYGAVYETWRSSLQPMVQSVQWKETAPADPMSSAIVVQAGSYEDIIYISDDTATREAEGFRFAGKTALVRRDKATGKPIWAYLYGEGQIEGEGVSVKGAADLRFKAVDAKGSNKDKSESKIRIDGLIPNDPSMKDLWLQMTFGDQSGYGMKIADAQGSMIRVQDRPPFELTEQGAKMLFYPNVQDQTGALLSGQNNLNVEKRQPRIIPGDVWVEIRKPNFFILE